MDIITELFENKRDDIIIDVQPMDEMTLNYGSTPRPIPYRRHGCMGYPDHINADGRASEFIVGLHTRYDNQELYELLCSLKDKFPKVKIATKPVSKRERLDVKKEFEKLYNELNDKNEEIQDEYYSLVAKLKILGVDCGQLLSPLPNCLPNMCWEWREYDCYQNCGIIIHCGKSTELFELIMNKFGRDGGRVRSDNIMYSINEGLDF
jgi:hypothetical protein